MQEGVSRALGSFCLLGRVAPRSFFAIDAMLVGPLNALAATAAAGTRTTTYVMASEDALVYQEQMPLREAPEPEPTVEELLRRPEGQSIEVKGSAFDNLDRYYKGEQAAGAGPLDDGVAIRMFCKAVVALLNAEGGHLVLGAVEAHRYESTTAAAEGAPVGDYLVTGLLRAGDASRWDGGAKDWDRFAQRLSRALSERIEPDPSPHVKVIPATLSERPSLPLVVLRIREPRRSPLGPWFYERANSDRHFWVRRGNATVQLQGLELDQYKQMKD